MLRLVILSEEIITRWSFDNTRGIITATSSDTAKLQKQFSENRFGAIFFVSFAFKLFIKRGLLSYFLLLG